ncbi:Urease subunit beta [Tissierellia bacterium S7-1-4]|nr:Urease subunit beta [Tissierellia bacterium S7-1-4]
MIPGEIFYKDEDIILNEGSEAIEIEVTNIGDRAVQIGSHFHFFEVNRYLKFDHKKAFGKRLNIPAGNAIRFEPGQTHRVELIDIGGNARVIGFNSLTNGVTQDIKKEEAMKRVIEKGYANIDEEEA